MESSNLALYAMKSANSRGRKHKEPEEDIKRLCFQKDRDRVIHCKAFRRLTEKTQVFVAGSGDHYRTRLTHTIEVAQISRDLARRLGLNEDLCEVIALAHDLGHPPFAHGGQEVLDEILKGYGDHFEHNEQSRRIVEILEKNYPDFEGLNLTYETIEGLMKHQTAFDQAGKKFERSAHLEAQIVNIADEIAYNNHDMDDAVRSGIVDITVFEKFELWQMAKEAVLKKYGKTSEWIFVSRNISMMIALMMEDLCQNANENLEKQSIKNFEDVRAFKGCLICFSGKMRMMISVMRKFLFENFYMHPKIMKEIEKGQKMVKEVFVFYMQNPDKLPKRFQRKGDPFYVSVKDYIAGMTDGFLLEEFEKLIQKR
ncbi:deoxyguanosinetriphosphate triphosphohydrolase [Candidatus Peregrinibacteria bacterium]|nr:deoxyguanosinetriphosphate triphosphohydrolase [Candidatus Peregrinibacteria bacterium]